MPTTTTTDAGASPAARWPALRYGALAAPLALVGLPLYVYLPSLFAQFTGLSLVAIGTVLLAARALEAVADPFLGRAIERTQVAQPQRLPRYAVGVAALMALCVLAVLQAGAWLGLFADTRAKVVALTSCVALAYLAYSWLTVAHHAVGAAIVAQGTRAESLYSTREALALAGVLLGSVLPLVMGWAAYGWVTAAMLALGLWALAPLWAVLRVTTATVATAVTAHTARFGLWQDRYLRRTWWAFFISNVSGSLPATLLGFFVADVLGLGLDAAPRYLAIYFLAAALGFAAWPKLALRWGTARVWAAAMLANGAIFAGAAFLSADLAQVAWWYGAVCFATGLLLGAELMLPQSLVASHLARIAQSQAAGSVFGWWTFAQKTALALAAGVGLWGLAWLGYAPSTLSTPAVGAAPLVWLYCIVPCLLKIAAAALAWPLHHTPKDNKP